MSDASETVGWRRTLGLDDQALLAECEVDRFRASGPGGQKRNKTESAVRLRHRPSGLEALAVESRSQHENLAKALRRLRVTIALALREPLQIEGYAPSEVVGTQISAGRLRVADRNPAYPAILGEVFDVLEAAEWRLSDAGTALGLSTASLGRFLEGDPVVFRAANERRAAFGLAPLRPAHG